MAKISICVSESPLEFEITGVDCIFGFQIVLLTWEFESCASQLNCLFELYSQRRLSTELYEKSCFPIINHPFIVLHYFLARISDFVSYLAEMHKLSPKLMTQDYIKPEIYVCYKDFYGRYSQPTPSAGLSRTIIG